MTLVMDRSNLLDFGYDADEAWVVVGASAGNEIAVKREFPTFYTARKETGRWNRLSAWKVA